MMNYCVSIAFILFVLPVCLAQTCEKLFQSSGEISYSAKSAVTKCWSVEVPENSYIRLDVKQLVIEQRQSCSEVYLKIEAAATKETNTYCSEDGQRRQPVTALSNVKITFHSNYYYSNYYTTSFRLSFITESLICAQNDHFRCSPHKCIHKYQVCNGIIDCDNGADEVGCEKGIAAIKGVIASLEKATTWLKNQMSTSYGWGKNTHRAITTLFLSKSASFPGKNLEEELMVKQLEVQTSLALLRNFTDPMSVSELSMFVNALQVTCHNPRKFYGHNLLQILGERAFVAHPSSASAYLALCNSNWTFTESDVSRVFKFLHKNSKYPFISDLQAVAVMAISCLKKQEHHLRSVDRKSLYDGTIKKFIDSQLHDGSFGNVYTTALVTQALISSGQEENRKWNVTATVNYLMKELDSSSVDFLSIYLTLPIFKGRSLVDIPAVHCSNTRKHEDDSHIYDATNELGGKMRVQYTLFVGDRKDVIHTMSLRVPEKSTAYDVMRVAQATDSKYRFHHRDVSGQMYVYNIGGITSDPEAGKFWLLYLVDRNENGTLTHYTENPDKLILEDEEILIMWYKTADISSTEHLMFSSFKPYY